MAEVKGYTRKGKNGKIVRVRAYTRKGRKSSGMEGTTSKKGSGDEYQKLAEEWSKLSPDKLEEEIRKRREWDKKAREASMKFYSGTKRKEEKQPKKEDKASDKEKEHAKNMQYEKAEMAKRRFDIPNPFKAEAAMRKTEDKVAKWFEKHTGKKYKRMF